ncbi:Endonuclease/exonuclease/phosphatase [Lasiosphaeris hirsuta]|uniref:Endonuclease/exonuclease/phosphatase n=1 Tax=Lasiosphaeris hirsuta TaxID=260670 RepID=A0AA40EC27_9PEZI|nr:Endonuclease/exonuclease/phosphatase [Lasiosphaeris hirsuta]
MAPSALDLFVLTFNCAKNLINVGVFASHLYGALSQNATGLPDLVVFSLQEVAPLSYAFVGSYLLNPYFARYEEALNLASARLVATIEGEDSDGTRCVTEQMEGRIPTHPYTLVRAKNVGMTAILLFARDLGALRQIEEAECGFGAAGMGNKGAVGLRVAWSEPGAAELGRSAELTFVATHLAAMEWNLKKRNANWRTIMSGLTFADPKAALPGVFPANQPGPGPDMSGAGDRTIAVESSESSDVEADDESDAQPLLDEDHLRLATQHSTTLQDMSIFKPTAYLFVAGDLNYRISSTTPPPLSPFPSFDPTSDNHHSNFLTRDQLTQERLAGRVFHGMTEAPINFGPTYKFDVLPSADGATNEAAVRAGAIANGIPEVPWRFASHRWPGWCDRVLYLDLPKWVSGRSKKAVEVRAYDALPVVRSSDHRPVFFRASVPLVAVEDLLPPAKGALSEAERADPRVEPPVLVDVHAWERRAAARRREIVVGWTALLWSTREGAAVMATLMVLALSGWWLFRGY